MRYVFHPEALQATIFARILHRRLISKEVALWQLLLPLAQN